MKGFLFAVTLFVVVAFPLVGAASPFLVCNPHASATKFQIEVNGEIIEANVTGETGALSIRHDLAGFADGTYVFRARAGNLWGWSTWTAPLDAAKVIPAPLSGFGVVE